MQGDTRSCSLHVIVRPKSEQEHTRLCSLQGVTRLDTFKPDGCLQGFQISEGMFVLHDGRMT